MRLLLQQITDFGQKFHVRRRFGRGGRFGLFQAVDLFDQHEDDEGDDHEIDDRVHEHAVGYDGHAGVFRGLYHVLLGRIAPLDGIGPDQLTLPQLVQRVRQGSFTEIVMATNPTVEGDGTALHISNLLADCPVSITRLARGITTGSILEYTNKEILADALTGRQRL